MRVNIYAINSAPDEIPEKIFDNGEAIGLKSFRFIRSFAPIIDEILDCEEFLQNEFGDDVEVYHYLIDRKYTMTYFETEDGKRWARDREVIKKRDNVSLIYYSWNPFDKNIKYESI